MSAAPGSAPTSEPSARAGWQVWSVETGACLRTVELAGHGLCAMFAPGGRHAVMGTKEGALDILDVGAATVVETLPAHTSAARQCLLSEYQHLWCSRGNGAAHG